MSELARGLVGGVSVAAASLILLAACGQTGKLYLPESGQGEVVTRPTQSPPPESGATSNSPQSVDSPPAPDSPAPEVTAPEEDDEKDGKDGTPGPPKK
jgi:predicted small lipoprotein YifL